MNKIQKPDVKAFCEVVNSYVRRERTSVPTALKHIFVLCCNHLMSEKERKELVDWLRPKSIFRPEELTWFD